MAEKAIAATFCKAEQDDAQRLAWSAARASFPSKAWQLHPEASIFLPG